MVKHTRLLKKYSKKIVIEIAKIELANGTIRGRNRCQKCRMQCNFSSDDNKSNFGAVIGKVAHNFIKFILNIYGILF